MRFLFRAFDAAGVRYLLISGQATVLYGGAFFSQDLDLWIEPTGQNLAALKRALIRLRARVHKLTPPLTLPWMKKGHGFHFIVPASGSSPVYLDLLGQPPRVGRFRDVARRARTIASPWGTLPVVGIEDLVEIKKTNRPADYEVITRLAMIRLDEEAPPSPSTLRWTMQNLFRVEDLWSVVEQFGDRLRPGDVPRTARRFLALHRRGRTPGLREMAATARLLSRESERLQNRGRAYWTPHLRELRRLRREEKLLPEGAPAADLDR